MNINFLYIPSSQEASDKFDSIRKKHLQDVKEFDNNFFISKIFNFLCVVKNNIDQKQKDNLQKQKEEDITDFIRRSLQQNEDFNFCGFKVDTEARNQDVIVGYYDLKFQHSDWINKYFVIECKPIDMSKNRIDSYIHKKNAFREDGGLYRFFINKYATNLSFGGMLGYIIKDTPEFVTNKLKEEIRKFDITDDSITYGSIIDKQLLSAQVDGFEYSFQSNHIRVHESEIIEPIHIFHLFIDLSSNV